MKKIIFIIICILSFSSFSKMIEGGATSGGGDFTGLDASKIVDKVFDSIQVIGDELYDNSMLDELNLIRSKIKIIIVDEKLPVDIEGKIQNGAAFSVRNGQISTIYLNRTFWEKDNSILAHEVLIHHELMVLIGVEQTGEYTWTKKFEEMRLNFWKLNQKENTLCTINVFEKNYRYGNAILGKAIGTGSSSINGVGSKADMGVLSELSNDEVLIWRGVIDSQGYFRMEINKVKKFKKIKKLFSRNDDDKLPAEFTIDLGTVEVLESERTYFNPYLLNSADAKPVTFGEHFAVVVNCNQF